MSPSQFTHNWVLNVLGCKRKEWTTVNMKTSRWVSSSRFGQLALHVTNTKPTCTGTDRKQYVTSSGGTMVPVCDWEHNILVMWQTLAVTLTGATKTCTFQSVKLNTKSSDLIRLDLYKHSTNKMNTLCVQLTLAVRSHK